MAVTEGPHGTRHLVVFDPSADTVIIVKDWKDSEKSDSIKCMDRSGIHTDWSVWYVSNILLDYGTMVVTQHR
jgi:hypothetical protein